MLGDKVWLAAFEFIPKVLDGVEADQSSSSTTNSENQFFMELLCARGLCHVETGKGHKLLTQSWKNTIV